MRKLFYISDTVLAIFSLILMFVLPIAILIISLLPSSQKDNSSSQAEQSSAYSQEYKVQSVVNQALYTSSNQEYPSKYYGRDKQPTAQCQDGTYSYSLGRRGVCSRHGGVQYWLKN
ncbi:Protein of uncharacterised function (DUF3761) [Moraxella cuniculi]|uniref:Protein of uncharacterized function (DUF3761) n=2 Tax=Moraxella cuniculi TaxID=34061 RepID=A0A448GU58_9GAMM|nr:Protein of uncharacterised function (DUF3761) [Moraxella cuniculi]